MQPEDPELLTRHEVLAAPPDVLITNYSMLEYMLMRPLERPIFDATRRWLANNPDERFLLVIDEAHLGPEHIVEGIERYGRDRDAEKRLPRLVQALDRARF